MLDDMFDSVTTSTGGTEEAIVGIHEDTYDIIESDTTITEATTTVDAHF